MAAHVACVLLAPWPLTLLSRSRPGVPVAVLSESRRVLFPCPEAQLQGVQTGMREMAALSRCPDLHAEVVAGPAASAAWAELLEALYARYSDRVEGRQAGIAFLKVSLNAARDLAAALHAPVGLADSREVAHLAALRTRSGEVRDVTGGQEKSFLSLMPIEHLQVLGVPDAQLQKLAFLGLRGLADLVKWSAAQREAFLGVDVGKKVNRFLKGERSGGVAKYVPGQSIEAHLSVDAPLLELGEAEAALTDLLSSLLPELRGRTAAYLTLHADTVGGRLSATRPLKWPLDDAGLLRMALLTLQDTDALPLGVDAMTAQLSGLQQPARMVGLWAGIAELEVTKTLLDRFPEALVRVQWLDPWAYSTDAQYQWVDWQTGTLRQTMMTPQQSPVTRSQRRETAIQQVLAFFEGMAP
ncbi:Y-family DNA polymerase [Deinococcus sp. QL22]|uniref:Y-family DNA polymerase n=1 Tax=Deinococcus sp. QL22 TaxID=2939437 RepID=UPI0020180FB7|nr:Y-family DNA polymerase [Deinococcus sp. QL22]UQN08730.1 Y-family DNA polymerase [Deinococcus sp. QL22]